MKLPNGDDEGEEEEEEEDDGGVGFPCRLRKRCSENGLRLLPSFAVSLSLCLSVAAGGESYACKSTWRGREGGEGREHEMEMKPARAFFPRKPSNSSKEEGKKNGRGAKEGPKEGPREGGREGESQGRVRSRADEPTDEPNAPATA